MVVAQLDRRRGLAGAAVAHHANLQHSAHILELRAPCQRTSCAKNSARPPAHARAAAVHVARRAQCTRQRTALCDGRHALGRQAGGARRLPAGPATRPPPPHHVHPQPPPHTQHARAPLHTLSSRWPLQSRRVATFGVLFPAWPMCGMPRARVAADTTALAARVQWVRCGGPARHCWPAHEVDLSRRVWTTSRPLERVSFTRHSASSFGALFRHRPPSCEPASRQRGRPRT